MSNPFKAFWDLHSAVTSWQTKAKINWFDGDSPKLISNSLEIPQNYTVTYTKVATRRLPKRYPSSRGYGRKR